MITLWEIKRLMLRREIHTPKNDSEKFNDTTDLVPADFSFAKNEKAMDVSLATVRLAGQNYQFGKNILPWSS